MATIKSIEEKARRYDEAIEIAKEINNEQQAQPFNIMTRVFPELKESEDDRVKNEIISAIKEDWPGHTEWIAWLEKQGEQKPQRMVSAEVKEAMYDKPAWSEEDEKRLSDAIFFVREYQIPTRDKRLLNAAKEAEDWLKSLRPQKKEALPQWRRLPLNGVSYAPDYWCVMDVITSTVGANSASVSALVKGDYYVPLFELEKFIRNI